MRGMFAIAIWDAPRRRLVLARDRVGKKPLYYMQAGDRFLFASEPKAILAALPTVPDISMPALLEFLTFGYVAGDGAIFTGMSRLEPGAMLVLEPSQPPRVSRSMDVAHLQRDGDPEAQDIRTPRRRARGGGADPASFGRAAGRIPQRRPRFGGRARADGEALGAAGTRPF